MEEGQSLRSVVDGPGTGVVVTVGEEAGGEVTGPAEDEAFVGEVVAPAL